MQGNPLAPYTWRKGQKPGSKARLNPRNALSKGLLRLYDPASAGYPAEYVRGSIASTWAAANSQVSGAMRGAARVTTAAGGNCNATDNGFMADITNQMTLFWHGEWVSGLGSMVFSCAASGKTAAYNWGVYIDSVGDWTCYIRNTSLTAVRPIGPNAVANTPVFVTATYDGATINLYLDGIWVASVAQTGNVNNVNYPLAIGDYWGAGGTSKSYLAGIYNRALSAAEIFSLAKDPYQLLEPVPAAMIGVTVAGGGTSYSASLALGIQMATNDNAGLAATGAVSLGMAAGVSEAGNMAAVSALTLGLQAGLSDNAVTALAGAVSLGAAMGLGEASILGAQAALSLNAILGVTPSQGAGTYFSTLSLGVIASTGAASGSQAVASLALGLGLAITSASLDAISGSLALGVIAGAGVNAGLAFNVNIPLGVIAGLQSGGGQSYGASLALGLVVGQAIAAATGLQVTPSERVLRVQAENRNLVIKIENRTLVISVENRNISIKLE